MENWGEFESSLLTQEIPGKNKVGSWHKQIWDVLGRAEEWVGPLLWD